MSAEEYRRKIGKVIGTPIDAISWDEAIQKISTWARMRESRYVCICNAHSVVTATREIEFAKVLQDADMATPDGAPVAWMLRRLGFATQERINGPDLMRLLCQHCAQEDISIYLYGSTEKTLAALKNRLSKIYPSLRIAGMESPAFGPVSEADDQATVQRINESGASIVFVGLGCPKQERWLAAHRGRVHSVMIGVGAAFDFHAGTVKRAPEWMRKNGMEWLHRLLSEPRRLWKRYLVTNSLYIYRATLQLLADRKNATTVR
ncbi:WecB/TagA/CpsF family glycosyltransferase [Cupriavidus sp. 8B]